MKKWSQEMELTTHIRSRTSGCHVRYILRAVAIFYLTFYMKVAGMYTAAAEMLVLPWYLYSRQLRMQRESS